MLTFGNTRFLFVNIVLIFWTLRLFQELYSNVIPLSNSIFNVILILRRPSVDVGAVSKHINSRMPLQQTELIQNQISAEITSVNFGHYTEVQKAALISKAHDPHVSLIANFYLYAMRGNNENQMRRRRKAEAGPFGDECCGGG